jgi:hypothetical protein
MSDVLVLSFLFMMLNNAAVSKQIIAMGYVMLIIILGSKYKIECLLGYTSKCLIVPQVN